MSEHTTAPHTYAGGSRASAQREFEGPQDTPWMGWVVFASVMLVLIGFFHALQGLVAIFDDEYYLVTDGGLTIELDYTAWGWAHLVLGGIVLFAGLSLYSGRVWARAVGVGVAAISAVVNFGFIAAYPVWSLIVIALDVFVILALTAHWND